MNQEHLHTPAERAAMHMFGIIYAILSSSNTALHTKKATLDTLQQVLNDKKGPFQQDDDMNEMGAAFVNSINSLIPQIKGESMLSDLFSKPEALN